MTDTALSLLAEVLHLRRNGERAPGGDETWAELDPRIERFLQESLPSLEPRRQALADAAAVFQRAADRWEMSRGTEDFSYRAWFAYEEGARVLRAWAEDPSGMDAHLAKMDPDASTGPLQEAAETRQRLITIAKTARRHRRERDALRSRVQRVQTIAETWRPEERYQPLADAILDVLKEQS